MSLLLDLLPLDAMVLTGGCSVSMKSLYSVSRQCYKREEKSPDQADQQ